MFSLPFLNAEWLGYAAALVGGGIACLSLLLPSRSLARVSFGLGMGLFALEVLFATFGSVVESPTEAAGWQGLRAVVLALFPACWLFFSLVFARGNRREFLTRWWPGLLVALALPFVVLFALPGQLITIAALSSAGGGWWFGLGEKGMIFNGLLLCANLLVLVNLERTFRASVGTMRWRIKFVIVGLGILFLMRIYTNSQRLLYHGWDSSLDLIQALALLAASILIVWSVLRCGLGEADVYPSRSVILGSFTFTIVGVYLLVVGVLAKGVALLGDEQSLPLQAIVILAGLILLGLFFVSDRVRLSIGLVLSRHFRRPFYDYREIWQRFTEKTLSEVEETAFCAVASSFISDLLQALSVTIWVVDEETQRLRFGGSTILTEEQAAQLILRVKLSDSLRSELEACDELIALDGKSGAQLQELSALCATEFDRKGGDNYILLLRTRQRLVGFLVLSDRVNGRRYSVEETDLLRTLGLEIAALLLNFQLLQRRSNVREAEALRTMATFFAHDLKNTGSTLSLTLQNLRRHFGNPDFRDDALRAVSKCVEHITHVVDGLSMLQSELKLDLKEEDLNALVRQTVTEMGLALTMRLDLDLQTLPLVPMDAGQMKKVLINLLLNARDAVAADGRVEVQTSANGRYVCARLADNGVGMGSEFIRKSLFRPFQTTKKRGLGIGLFQCKMIVEAHGGRIEVESWENIGTSFQILLPVKEQID